MAWPWAPNLEPGAESGARRYRRAQELQVALGVDVAARDDGDDGSIEPSEPDVGRPKRERGDGQGARWLHDERQAARSERLADGEMAAIRVREASLAKRLAEEREGH